MCTRFTFLRLKNNFFFLTLLILFSGSDVFGQQSLIWKKIFGSSGYDRVMDIAFDGSGNFYALGRFDGTVDLDPGPGTFNLTSNGLSDIFITKFDPAGNFIWAKGFGGTGWDIGSVIKTDAAGNVYLSGIYQNTANFYNGSPTAVYLTSKGSDDGFIIKLTSGGSVVWAKSIGGTGQDFISDMVLDASGTLFLTGAFNNTADFNPGPQKYELTSAGGWDIFICVLDNAGNFSMATSLGGTNFDSGAGIAVDNTGNIYVTGSFVGNVDFDPNAGVVNLTSAGSDDVFILKLNSAGSLLWVRQQGGNGWECAGNIEIDAAGNIYNAGRFMGVTEPHPGSGFDHGFTAVGDEDFYVSKFDAAGNFQWAKQIGSVGKDAGTVMLDPSGSIFLSGKFNTSADIDPGPGTYIATSAGTDAFFMSELNSAGNFICGGVINGSGNIEAFLKLNSGNIFVAGGFENTIDVNPGSGLDTTTSSGLHDAFIAKLSTCLSASAPETEIANVISVFPNPNSGKFRVSGGKENLVEIRVYNILGSEILTKYTRNVSEDLDLSDQPKGVYFVNMTVGKAKEKLIRRVIVE